MRALEPDVYVMLHAYSTHAVIKNLVLGYVHYFDTPRSVAIAPCGLILGFIVIG